MSILGALNPYPYLACILVGFVGGGILAWEIQSWRLDAEKLAEAQDNMANAQAIIKQQNAQVAAWILQVQENQKEAQAILDQQKQIQTQADAQNAQIAKQIASIQNAAKSLTLTNFKLDAAHQQLLASISSAANNAITTSTQAPVAPTNAKSNSSIPKLTN